MQICQRDKKGFNDDNNGAAPCVASDVVRVVAESEGAESDQEELPVR